MTHSANLRRPRILVGQGGLSKCIKCGVAFVAKQPAQQTCSKCSGSRTQREGVHSAADHAARVRRSYGGA